MTNSTTTPQSSLPINLPPPHPALLIHQNKNISIPIPEVLLHQQRRVKTLSTSESQRIMGSIVMEKRHAVCIPYPAQGHINPMLKLAKLLHHKGFYITFVNTEYNHHRLLRSRGPDSLNGLADFRFRTIPDGLPPTDSDVTQDIPSLCESTSKTCLAPFRDLLTELNYTPNVPPVSCVVSDGVMSFTLDAAEEFRLPEVIFWTTSACGFLAYFRYKILMERGIIPLKDESYLSNDYLNTQIDGIPGLKNIRLRDFPSFLRTTNPDDLMVNFVNSEAQRAPRASALILNTFDELEQGVLDSLRTIFPNTLTVGPLSLMCNHIDDSRLHSMASNLWKEDTSCLEWLDTKDPGSIVYVNFGSITVMTAQQLEEFAWGLANSNHPFLWVIRPDLVKGDSAILPEEFVAATGERGRLVSWVPQEQVLAHPSVGGFLTHCGWNSTLESVFSGVPIICWPFFAEQQTNCRFSCTEWGIGMEIDADVKREEVAGQVRELMEGEKGMEMRRKVKELQNGARKAALPGGSSYVNLDKLVKLLE